MSGLSRSGTTVLINPGVERSDVPAPTVSPASSHSAPGSALWGSTSGTLAEYVVVPSANVRRVAAESNPAEGAAFTLSTLTAWRMLASRARLLSGGMC